VIGALEDAEDYQAFEAAIIADYDAQSAVERELVLRLASILWRLRRATTMETGLFEIQAQHLRDYGQNCRVASKSRDVIHTLFRPSGSTSLFGVSRSVGGKIETVSDSTLSVVEFARCFLRLANLPNFALDRLSRYEASLWRATGCFTFSSRSAAKLLTKDEARRIAANIASCRTFLAALVLVLVLIERLKRATYLDFGFG
jgi:hypothetical protein